MPQVGEYQPLLASTDVVIANGESLSAAVDVSGCTAMALHMPAAWTAADITVQGSADGVSFADVYHYDGDEMVISADASRYITLLAGDFAGLRHLKLRSGTGAAAVNQGAERSITLLSRVV